MSEATPAELWVVGSGGHAKVIVATARAAGLLVAGLFDEHTNFSIDWLAPIQSLSMSRLPEDAVGIALTCLGSWGTGQREVVARGDQRIVVRDEAWRQLRLGPEAVKAFDADMRLSRGFAGQGGDIQYAVGHKPSDLLSAGDAGSNGAVLCRSRHAGTGGCGRKIGGSA